MSDTTTDATYRVAADQLRQIVERIEKLNAESKEIAETRKEVLAEAKGQGLDATAILALVKIRAADKDKLSEAEAVLEMYKEALGL